jgi:hypothetical protein
MVRTVKRTKIVHCAELPPSPVIRNSFGSGTAVLDGTGTEVLGGTGAAELGGTESAGLGGITACASSMGADGQYASISSAPVPAFTGLGNAFADVAASDSKRQSKTGRIGLVLTPLLPPAPLLQPSSSPTASPVVS